MPPVSPELQKLAAEAGVDHSVVQYLQARGILSMGILGALAKSFDEIDAAVVQPFIAGHNIAGVTHQAAPDTEPVVTASIRYLWKKSWTQLNTVQLVKTTPITVSQAPSAATAPMEIPAQELQELVQHYENQMIDGEKRYFPVKMLLGAEKVIARAWHENRTASQTPLLLPEILVLRHFDASGGTNSLAISSTEDQQKWSPKGVLSILDALDAVMWCWLLIRIGKEPHILEYIQWWRQLVRGKSAKLEQIKSYWVDCGWKLALELRHGRNFREITQELMLDQHGLQTALQKDPPIMPKARPAQPSAPKAPGNTQETGHNTQGQKRWRSQDHSWHYPQKK